MVLNDQAGTEPGDNNQAIPGWHQAPVDRKWGTMPKLQLILKGIQRGQAEAGRTRSARLRMTPELFRILKWPWTSGMEPEGDMLWASGACKWPELGGANPSIQEMGRGRLGHNDINSLWLQGHHSQRRHQKRQGRRPLRSEIGVCPGS